MAIYQLLPTLAYGDAIGNETLYIDDLLKKAGVKTAIYACNATPQMQNKYIYYKNLNKLLPEDIIIYHFMIGCQELYEFLRNVKCKKIMIYHNITPSKFFEEYSKNFYECANLGRKELRLATNIFDYCLADSEYNKQELIDVEYKVPIDILPLIINFDDYDKALDLVTLEKYANDDYTNILFVGRIAPNKKQEDIIRIFNFYKKNINPKSRLIFVGNFQGLEKYYLRLMDYVRALELDDVVFTGHVSFNSILSYYNLADIFLCMSEHEGFCVPLVEAMYFDIPVIAYESTAIPYILRNSGCIVKSKDPKEVSMLIHKILCDLRAREKVLQEQKKILEEYQYKITSKLFLDYINKYMKV